LARAWLLLAEQAERWIADHPAASLIAQVFETECGMPFTTDAVKRLVKRIGGGEINDVKKEGRPKRPQSFF